MVDTPETQAPTETKKTEDTVVLAPTPPAPEPTPVTKPSASLSSTDAAEGDDDQVASLKIQLASFAKTVMKPGKDPKDFVVAGKMSLQITKFIIAYPKVPVLDTFLAFFEETLSTVCLQKNYLKGSTNLSKTDEQQVGYLYSLFVDLASKSNIRINSAMVVNVLKKPEILNYYNRKMAGIIASA